MCFCLVDMGENSAALSDIQQAFTAGYPQENRLWWKIHIYGVIFQGKLYRKEHVIELFCLFFYYKVKVWKSPELFISLRTILRSIT